MFSQIKTKTRLAIQLSFFIALAVTTVALLFSFVYGFVVRDSTRQELLSRGNDLIRDHVVLRGTAIFLKKNVHEETLGTSLRYRSLSASIYDQNLKSVARYGAFLTSERDEIYEDSPSEIVAINTARKTLKPVYITKREAEIGEFETILIPLVNESGFLGVLQVGKDMSSTNSLLYLNYLLMLFFIPSGVIISFVLASMTVTSAFAPLGRILKLMQKIETDTLHKRIEIKGAKDDEIVQLSHSLNAMLDRLEEGVEKQKNFISHASHELKTPLTQAISSIDIASRYLKDKQYRKGLGELPLIKADLHHLNELVNTLLIQATIKKGFSREATANLRTVLKYITQQNSTLIKAKQASIVTKFAVSAVQLSTEELKIILGNLISNALKYSTTPAKISVTLRKIGTGGILTVSDNGTGMSPDALAHGFEEFYRGSTVGAVEGFGLGLSIVKEICDARQLRISVEPNKTQGTRVVISGLILDK
ncbi:MAG: HAMP domain-containing sensor histidine kinase [Patescibacteria group bacterium]|jgi:signal transduction histidine kinase